MDFLQQNKKEINELCINNNTSFIDLKNINHRIYITLAILKKEMPFYV